MDIPQLIFQNGHTQLLHDGKPFLILGGETRNSSASSLIYMEEKVWPNVAHLNLNTLLMPISWELMEHTRGQYDFTLVDGLIRQAEDHGMHLVFLWFGLWKNGMSTYVPQWMKDDPETFFPVRDRHGRQLYAVSPLCEDAVRLDAEAFQKLMAHLREFDRNRTVLMVQVENEMGVLGDCRDFSPAAEALYQTQIPGEIADWSCKTGTWEQAFGQEAPELFMTWCYACATQKIASAGKAAYPIPLYVNAWLEQFPWRPGTYPTGGPIARHMDLWKLLAPAIDFFAPDIYAADFEKISAEYTALGNPLFVPEARASMDSASNVFSAFGRFGAIGFSPFAIEDIRQEAPAPSAQELEQLNILAEAFQLNHSADYLTKSYAIIDNIRPLLERYMGTGHIQGFTQHHQDGEWLKFGRYDFLVHFPPRSDDSPKGGGLVIELGEDEFLLCGLNFQAKPHCKPIDRADALLAWLEEGCFRGDQWIPRRRLNGDEFHITFRKNPGILRCKLRRD